MVGFETGFDENFFAALKKKLLEKNEFQRHGMVLFDEMQCLCSARLVTVMSNRSAFLLQRLRQKVR
ncbi:hypothetical protein HPB47_021320 [Ixodes persulcatus]|uniref:Uncharacterized protein n=1 Tax=Ixodes persulcatus TaxID=34615 RepID=A0AC60QD23_IXOPE|nr:hypothetical protein HPB47_021320 [Ixodes persulcatus]